jgi:hypothetical protein
MTRRRLAWGALSAIALAALGTGIFLALGDRLQQPDPGGAPRPPATPDSSRTGDPVVSLLSITQPVAGGASSSVVSLKPARYHESVRNDIDESIMAHEVVRQAVLLASRDAGAIVRDASIGDPVPDAAAAAEIEVGSLFAPTRVPVAILARREAGGRKVLATFDLGGPAPRLIDYATLVERAEALSRSEGGFPKVLVATGLKANPTAPDQGGRPGEEIERRLARLTFTEQFAAIRELHGEIRDRGESPERLGALARGYANLGALTDFHWNAGSKTFKARALLAAQRMVALDPGSPRAFWHRAYARALVGFHKDALGDLDSAARLAQARPGGDPAPPWVALVDALCRFQTKKLVASGSGADGQLAMFLAFLTAEFPATSMTQMADLGRDLLQANPECYRVHDALCGLNVVGVGHWATAAGLQAFTESVPRRLGELPGLPGAVAAKLPGGDEAEVERALLEASRGVGDRGEPSWGSLGRMVRDGRFALLIRRAVFMKWIWSVPTADFVAEARPLVADHPYLPFLESLAVDYVRDPDGYAALLRRVDVPDLDFAEERFVVEVSRSDQQRHQNLVRLMICHGDTFYRDLAIVSRWLSKDGPSEAARHIEEVSPYAPLARARLIDNDWPYTEPQAKEWEAEAISGEHSDVLSCLGRRYVALKRWDDAERCLSKAIDLSPDIETLRMLASAYKGRGDLERWKSTLERALEVDDPGLHHMVVRVELANYLMEQGQAEKALPYAEAAAATWAGNGMNCAAVCHEQLGHWEEAELWVRRSTERYPQQSWLNWFVWCRRTGRGDLAAARASALASIAGFGDRAPDGVREWFGTFHIIDGAPREALSILLPIQERAPNAVRGIMIASLSDDIGDAAGRDRALAELDALPQAQQLKLASLLKALRSGLSAGKFDPEATVAALREVPAPSRYLLAVFVGRLMHAHGSADVAREILQRSYEMSGDVGWVQAAAKISLREWEKPADPPAPAK